MSHQIIIIQSGTGTGGSAKATIEYTPDHSVPGAKQIRKAERAAEMLEKINDMLYGPETDEA